MSELLNTIGPYAGQFAVNMGTSVAGGLFNKRSQRRAYNYNKRLWSMQNEYNHPKAQVQRLIDAGINPDLLYGGSTGQTAGNAQQMPKYQAESWQMHPTDIASIKLAQSQADVNEAKVPLIKQQQIEKEIENHFEQWKKFGIITAPRPVDQQGNYTGLEAKQYQINLDLSKAQRDKFLQETDNLTKESPWYELKGNLAKSGININDPVLMRMVYTVAKEKGWLDDSAMLMAIMGYILTK